MNPLASPACIRLTLARAGTARPLSLPDIKGLARTAPSCSWTTGVGRGHEASGVERLAHLLSTP